MMMNAQAFLADIQCHFISRLNNEFSQQSEMLQYIAEQLTIAIQCDACSIYWVELNNKNAFLIAGSSYYAHHVDDDIQVSILAAKDVIEHPDTSQRLGVTGWVISTGKSFIANNILELKSHPHYLENIDRAFLPDKDLNCSWLSVPVNGPDGNTLGVITLERIVGKENYTVPFSIEEQLFVESVARSAGRLLTYLDVAFNVNPDAAITVWAKDMLSSESLFEGNLESYLDLAVRVVASAMRADSCGIYLIDQSKKSLTQRAGVGSEQLRYSIRSYSLPDIVDIPENPLPEERLGITAWIAATGKSFYARNLSEMRQHPHHRGQYDPINFERQQVSGAFLGYPLQVSNTVVGVIKVLNITSLQDNDSRDFDLEARNRLDTLAREITLGIIQIQRYSGTPYQVLIDAQKGIIRLLAGNWNTITLVNKVVMDTMSLLNARACSIYLVEKDLLVQPEWAAAGYASKSSGACRTYTLVPLDKIPEHPTKPEEKVGLTAWIAATRQKYSARSYLELHLHPHHKGMFDAFDFQPSERCESFMGAPLIAGDELIGVLKVETKKRLVDGREEYTYFTDQDELVFDLIASTAAIAIKNSRLVEANRLTDLLTSQPNLLLVNLHEYLQGASLPAEILEQVAGLVGSKKKNVADVVSNYAQLLQPQISPSAIAAIPQLMEKIGDFVQGGSGMSQLYTEYSKALNAVSIADLVRNCSEIPNALKSLSAEPFFLSPAVNVLVSLAQQIHEAIPLDNISHSSLDDARTSLEMLREKANNLVQPEREIQLQIIEHWVQIVSAARYAFLRENPYVVGRPIDPQSGAQFFGRKDIFNWISDNLYGGSPQNILVFHGERRMGKTSILLQLLRGDLGREMRERAKRSLCPIYIDLQNFNDSGTAAFLRKFAKEINRQIQNQGIQVPELEQFEKLPYDTFDDFIASICSLHQQRQLILMLDEFERLDSLVSEGMLDKNIFAQLRTLMQFKQNLSFLFAGTHELGELSPEYCELLRSIALVQEVGFLDEFDSRALIQEPVAGKVNYAPNATSEIYRLTHGHPYLIQWLCHDLIDGMNKRGEGNYITQNHVVSCAQQFVSKRDVYLRDLWTSSSEIEKAILRTLANAPIGTAAPIIYGGLVAFPTEAVEFGFSRLEKRGLIEQNPAESNLYIHSILLFSNWITQNPRLL